ncbi:MAG: CYTH domain-containing protein [Desulfomonilia bacterium]|jgi:hypothetical protein
MPEEFELTLRACCTDARSLFRSIASLRSLGPYATVLRHARDLHDEYFDTRSAGLSKASLALRLRTAGPRTLLCLKGRERIDEHGSVRRLEIEGPWSRETLEQVSEAAEGILPEPAALLPDDPRATLLGMGLLVIQSRAMHRTVLDIVPAGDAPGSPLGELALDAVEFRLKQGVYLHHEAEIEAASKDREAMVPAFASLLMEAFPGALCPWPHNKLVTGLALDALVSQGAIPEPPGEGIAVTEEAYARIDAWVRQGRPAS